MTGKLLNQIPQVQKVFYDLLNVLTLLKGEQVLRDRIKDVLKSVDCGGLQGSDFLKYGFGSSHMWIAQHKDGVITERLILVRF